jgi:hypothetical protein
MGSSSHFGRSSSSMQQHNNNHQQQQQQEEQPNTTNVKKRPRCDQDQDTFDQKLRRAGSEGELKIEDSPPPPPPTRPGGADASSRRTPTIEHIESILTATTTTAAAAARELDSDDADAVQRGLSALKWYMYSRNATDANDPDASRRVFLKLNGVSKLVELMETWQADPQVLRLCCHCLVNGLKSVQVSAVREPVLAKAFQNVLACMCAYPANPGLLFFAMTAIANMANLSSRLALRYLCDDSNNSNNNSGGGGGGRGLDLLLQIMEVQVECDVVQQAACIALHVLSELPALVPHLLHKQCRSRLALAVEAFPTNTTIQERGHQALLNLIRYAQQQHPPLQLLQQQ